jgi:hypothetical protein
MDELKVIMQDIENVYHQLGAVLRDLDMILSDMDVDTDPPDEYVDGLLRGVELSEEFDHA